MADFLTRNFDGTTMVRVDSEVNSTEVSSPFQTNFSVNNYISDQTLRLSHIHSTTHFEYPSVYVGPTLSSSSKSKYVKATLPLMSALMIFSDRYNEYNDLIGKLLELHVSHSVLITLHNIIKRQRGISNISIQIVPNCDYDGSQIYIGMIINLNSQKARDRFLEILELIESEFGSKIFDQFQFTYIPRAK